MFVLNKTKNIITLPVDHRGNQVAACFPGWSEVPDSSWFAREVELTEETEVRGFGKKVVHGAEIAAKQRIEVDHLEILGEAEGVAEGEVKPGKPGKPGAKADGAEKVRRSLTLSEVSTKRAREVISGCNRSDMLKAWKEQVGESLRMDIAKRLDDLKEAAANARNPSRKAA